LRTPGATPTFSFFWTEVRIFFSGGRQGFGKVPFVGSRPRAACASVSPTFQMHCTPHCRVAHSILFAGPGVGLGAFRAAYGPLFAIRFDQPVHCLGHDPPGWGMVFSTSRSYPRFLWVLRSWDVVFVLGGPCLPFLLIGAPVPKTNSECCDGLSFLWKLG